MIRVPIFVNKKWIDTALVADGNVSDPKIVPFVGCADEVLRIAIRIKVSREAITIEIIPVVLYLKRQVSLIEAPVRSPIIIRLKICSGKNILVRVGTRPSQRKRPVKTIRLSSYALSRYAIVTSLDSTTRANVSLQNNNTDIVADKKIEASNDYKGDINNAYEKQAADTVGAVNTGSGIAASSTRQGAGIQLSGVRGSAVMEKETNQLNFEERTEAASNKPGSRD